MRTGSFTKVVFVTFVAFQAAACTGVVGGPFAGSDDTGEQSGGGARGGSGLSAGSGGRGTAGGSGTDGKGSSGAEGSGSFVSGARFARLTHFQWQNSVRDLLRLKTLPTLSPLKSDAVLGFDNNNSGTALDVSFDLRSDYERAAETLAAFVVADDAAVARLVPANAPAALEAKGRAAIRAVGERAYRRPMASSEEDELWLLFKQGPSLVPQGDPFKAGMQVLVSALLQSPFFLYRPELGSSENTKDFSLTPFELATRLSYALADTMPDDELFAAAKADRLQSEEQIKQQASRLLATPAAAVSAAHFHEQLYQLARFDKIEKDSKLFPNFGSDMSSMLKEEARRFLDDIVQGGKSPAAILTSPYTFANDRLAEVYGVSAPAKGTFEKVQLNPTQRSGMLTQLGFLAANAGARDPDPIHRGVFISQVVLCKTLPPPAANVPPVPSTGGKTNRERVEAHTGKGTCGASCHAGLINPLGYAFESFDAVGRHRTTDNGAAVDTSGTYDHLGDDSVAFADGVALSSLIAKSPDFHTCYLQNWVQYLWARSAKDDDAASLQAAVKASISGQSVRDLLLTLVTTPDFRRRQP